MEDETFFVEYEGPSWPHIPMSECETVDGVVDTILESLPVDRDNPIVELFFEQFNEVRDEWETWDVERRRATLFNLQVMFKQIMMLVKFAEFAEHMYHMIALTEIAAHTVHHDFFEENPTPKNDDWSTSEKVIAILLSDDRRGFHATMVSNMAKMWDTAIDFANAHGYVPDEAVLSGFISDNFLEFALEEVRRHIVQSESGSVLAGAMDNFEASLEALFEQEEDNNE